MFLFMLMTALHAGASEYSTCASYLLLTRGRAPLVGEARPQLLRLLKEELKGVAAPVADRPVEASSRSTRRVQRQVAARVRHLLRDEGGAQAVITTGNERIVDELRNRLALNNSLRSFTKKTNATQFSIGGGYMVLLAGLPAFVPLPAYPVFASLIVLSGIPESFFRQLAFNDTFIDNHQYLLDQLPTLKLGDWHYYSRNFRLPKSIVDHLRAGRFNSGMAENAFFSATYPKLTARLSGRVLDKIMDPPETAFSRVRLDELLIWRDNQPELITYVRMD